MSELNDPRVLFAAERTMLAWSRTSLALIGFGFVVERSGLLMAFLLPAPRPGFGSESLTFVIGLAFIAIGIFAAYFSSRQYLCVLNTLKPSEIPRGYSPRWGLALNGFIGVLGAALGVAVYLGRM